MFGITERTVIPLGGNVIAVASADGLAGSASLSADANLVIGGGATLAATGVTLVAPAPSQTYLVAAVPALACGTVALGDGTSIRVSSASLSADATISATGDATFTNETIEPLDLSVDLVAAGGKQFDDSTADLAAELSVSIVNPGRLFDGALDVMALSVSMETSVSPVYRLVLPTRKSSITRNILWSRFPVDVGVALVITGGQARLLESVSDIELREADHYFLGGYRHQITPAQRAAVIAAGYGELVEEA